MKQSATDPKTGLIDINILTTGLSVSDRKRRLEIAKALKELLLSKGKTPSVKYQQTYEELREGSDLVSESSQLHSEFEFKKNLTQTFTPKFRHKHWFPCEMTTDWLKQISHAARTNQKHFLDLGSDRSSVWSSYSRRLFAGNQWQRHEVSAVFPG